MEEKNKIINSFYLKDTLNPELWNNPKNPDKSSLKEEIRIGLIDIAEEFLTFLDVSIFVQDITMTGSLANFNWSNFSDIDLHIIYDFSEAGELKDLYSEIFNLKKTLFNSSHDIRVRGYEVELYVQDMNEVHMSSGVYSLLYDKWIEKPKSEKVKLELKKVKEKAYHWMDIIDTAIDDIEDMYDLDDAVEKLDKVKDKLKKFRSSGLERGGEYSYENLVFKYLRRNGYIQKLFDSKIDIVDKQLSIDENLDDIM